MAGKRIKVAIVSEPGKAGVKTHVVTLLKHIDLSRFDVTFYHSLQRIDAKYVGEIAELTARGIDCVQIPMEGSLGLFHDLRGFVNLAQKLRRNPPAVLHLHSSKAGGLGRLASLLLSTRPKVLYTPHAMACYGSRLYLWLERILGTLTGTLISVSASERADFIRWRIPKAKTARTIPLGVEPMTRSSHTRSDSTRWTMGACGRIGYQKNALLFFQVALEVIKSDPNAHFRWIGDFGEDCEATTVRRLLKKEGNPSQIEITGWVPDPEVYLETLDVFCMFSRYESFGYVTAEAMLLEVPILATEATGTIDLIKHEVTGLITEANVPAITKALARLQSDLTLRSELSQNARRFITERHTIERMVAATEQLYVEVIES